MLRKRIRYFDLNGTSIEASELPARRERARTVASGGGRQEQLEAESTVVPYVPGRLPATVEPIDAESAELSCRSCGAMSRPDRAVDRTYCSSCGARFATHQEGSWEQLEQSSAPPARSLFSAAFDPVGRKIYIFGGRQGRVAPIVWEGVSLLMGAAPPSPPPFPSHNCMSDLWAFSTQKSSWEEVMPHCMCGGRCGHNAFWDPAERQLHVFGGRAAGGARPDSWAYAPDHRLWSEISHFAGSDDAWQSAAWDSSTHTIYFVVSCWNHRFLRETYSVARRVADADEGVTKLYVGPLDGGPWKELKVSVRLPGSLRTACDAGPPQVLFLRDDQTLWIYTIGEDSWRTVDFGKMGPGDWQIGCAAWDSGREQLYILLSSTSARATRLWVYSLGGPSCRSLDPSGSSPPLHESYAAVWDGVERRLYVLGATSDSAEMINVWSYRTAG